MKKYVIIGFGILVVLLVGCRTSVIPQASSSGVQNLERDDWRLVHVDELRKYLRSRELLDRLRMKQVVVYDAEIGTAAICAPGGIRSHVMIYYTIQKGWYLPQDNEKVVHRRGEGWSIQKQNSH